MLRERPRRPAGRCRRRSAATASRSAPGPDLRPTLYVSVRPHVRRAGGARVSEAPARPAGVRPGACARRPRVPMAP